MSTAWLPTEKYVVGMPKATAYGCFPVTFEDDRPFQLRSARDANVWRWPGSNGDPGKAPRQCAVRECLEETGLHLDERPPLLSTQLLTTRANWSSLKIGFVFDGGRLPQNQIESIVLDAAEHSKLAVHTLEDWKECMSEPAFRLVEMAEACNSGSPGRSEGSTGWPDTARRSPQPSKVTEGYR